MTPVYCEGEGGGDSEGTIPWCQCSSTDTDWFGKSGVQEREVVVRLCISGVRGNTYKGVTRLWKVKIRAVD